ncbi:MAG: polyphenol oxidase family protein [Gemmatimonadota bacterium]|nr:polyphenol oxidase family protein [Gemmatimonadota bacterium]
MKRVAETRLDGDVPLWVHPEWAERFPWLVQGTTGSGFDLGLFGDQPIGAALQRWRALRSATGMNATVHARQVHGSDVAVHGLDGLGGMLLMEGVDGHLTDQRGLLLTVSVADCVPVSIVDPEKRAVALVHAGWRGTAAGIVGRALERLREVYDASPADLWLHAGPAICGDCYEVGPEVHAALRPEKAPPAVPTPIDVRAVVAGQAVMAGMPRERLSVSAHCTRCGPGDFFSHRVGSPGRQMGVLGVR